MTASTDWQQGVNWMTKASVASTCGLLRPLWHLNIKEPPLSSSLHVCGLPAPSRIDEQEQAEERRERELILISLPHLYHLPVLQCSRVAPCSSEPFSCDVSSPSSASVDAPLLIFDQPAVTATEVAPSGSDGPPLAFDQGSRCTWHDYTATIIFCHRVTSSYDYSVEGWETEGLLRHSPLSCSSIRCFFDLLLSGFEGTRMARIHAGWVHCSTSGIIVLLLYVDDILIIGSDVAGIRSLINSLSRCFEMKVTDG